MYVKHLVVEIIRTTLHVVPTQLSVSGLQMILTSVQIIVNQDLVSILIQNQIVFNHLRVNGTADAQLLDVANFLAKPHVPQSIDVNGQIQNTVQDIVSLL